MEFENIEEDDFPVAASCKNCSIIGKVFRNKMKSVDVRFISKANSHFPYNSEMYEECFGVKIGEKILSGVRAKDSPDFSFLINDYELMEKFIKFIKSI